MLFVLVLIAATCVVVGANVYLHRRLSLIFGLGPRPRRVLAALMVAAFLATVAGRLLRRAGLATTLASAAGLEAFTWAAEIGVVLSALVLVPFDALQGTLGLARRFVARRNPVPGPPLPAEPAATDALPAHDPSHPARPLPTLPRRAFLDQVGGAAAVALGGGSSIYGTLFGRHDYGVEEVVLGLPRLAPAYHGYTIVQLSDLHFGTFVGERELEAAVDLVRAARPDLLVLTGDLVDHDLGYLHLVGRLARRLEGLARDGLYVIPGNHDHYAGVDAVLAAAAAGGATVLLNAGRVIGSRDAGLNLLGVDDVMLWGRAPGAGPDLERALQDAAPELPRVLLCHNPSYFVDCFEQIDLQLSGHTHGGQVQLGLNPAELVLPYGYVAGRYVLGGAQLYVNRGFGTAGPPTRVFTPPEVTRVVLTGA